LLSSGSSGARTATSVRSQRLDESGIDFRIYSSWPALAQNAIRWVAARGGIARWINGPGLKGDEDQMDVVHHPAIAEHRVAGPASEKSEKCPVSSVPGSPSYSIFRFMVFKMPSLFYSRTIESMRTATPSSAFFSFLASCGVRSSGMMKSALRPSDRLIRLECPEAAGTTCCTFASSVELDTKLDPP
jgi:hypothetical protein